MQKSIILKRRKLEKKIHRGENGENWPFYGCAHKDMRQEDNLYSGAPNDTFTSCQGLLHHSLLHVKGSSSQVSGHCTLTSPDGARPLLFGSSGGGFMIVNILQFLTIHVVSVHRCTPFVIQSLPTSW